MKKKFGLIAVALCIILTFTVFTGCDRGKKEEELSKYTINAVYDEENKTVSADMTLSYVNGTDAILDEVCFHLYPAAFREGARFSPVPADMVSTAYPEGMSYGGIAVNYVTLAGQNRTVEIAGEDEDILVVALPEDGKLYPGEKAEISVGFTLEIPCVRHRFGYTGSTVNLGNWYPVACVFEDGNFVTDPYYANGDPFYSDCADYEVNLTVPENLTVASTGTSSFLSKDGKKTFSAKASSVRDFAAVIGEFKMLGTQVDGIDVNYYYVDDASPETSLTAAADSIKTFGNLFGKYPYESYSAVETSFLHGGMEYPGLTMISDLARGDLYTEVIIHETAHQWWYAAVGNNEVAHAWMDEGLTEFSTSLFYENNPSYNVDYNKRMADALSAYILYYDSFKHINKDTSMTRKVSEYSDGFEYTYMNYVKGELMFEALRNALGDENFFGGLKTYYEEYKFENAKPDDMIGCFEKASGRQLKSFFDSWLEGKVGMYGGLNN